MLMSKEIPGDGANGAGMSATGDIVRMPSPDEIAGPSKAKRKAGEHDRPHQADPLDRRQGRVDFLLDSRKQDADAADALHVEKRSEANDQENA